MIHENAMAFSLFRFKLISFKVINFKQYSIFPNIFQPKSVIFFKLTAFFQQ